MYATERPARWGIAPTTGDGATDARKNAKIVYMCVTIAISLSTGSAPTDAFGLAMANSQPAPAEASHIFHTAAETIDGNNAEAFTGNATKSRALYATEDAIVDRTDGLKLHVMQMMQRDEICGEYGDMYAILKPGNPSRQDDGPKIKGVIIGKVHANPTNKRETIRKELSDAMDARMKREKDALNSSPIIVVYPKYMPSPAKYVDLLHDAERFRHLVRSDAK